MVLFKNDEFLSRLDELYTLSQRRSVWVTFKRLNMGGEKGEPVCLVRATDGKTKISTHIGSSDVVRFQMAMEKVSRSSFTGMKKRTKKKRKPAQRAV